MPQLLDNRFLEAVIKQAKSFSCLFNLRILMPRHGNSKSFLAYFLWIVAG
jgi:hypothetical protein